MSLYWLAEDILQIERELEVIKKTEEQLKAAKIRVAKAFIGGMDQYIVEKLKLSHQVTEYHIDGTTWYKIAMKDIGTEARLKFSAKKAIYFDCFPVGLFPYPYYTFAPTKLIKSFGELKVTKAKDVYNLDAMMLTDCKGHRIHTCHSFEGQAAVPHWYVDGWIDIHDVEKAVRHFLETAK